MRSLSEKFVVLCGIIMGVWLTYSCVMMLLVSTRPQLFTEYQVYPGTFLVMGTCYTPVLNEQTAKGFYMCMNWDPNPQDMATFLAYIK